MKSLKFLLAACFLCMKLYSSDARIQEIERISRLQKTKRDITHNVIKQWQQAYYEQTILGMTDQCCQSYCEDERCPGPYKFLGSLIYVCVTGACICPDVLISSNIPLCSWCVLAGLISGIPAIKHACCDNPKQKKALQIKLQEALKQGLQQGYLEQTIFDQALEDIKHSLTLAEFNKLRLLAPVISKMK